MCRDERSSSTVWDSGESSSWSDLRRTRGCSTFLAVDGVHHGKYTLSPIVTHLAGDPLEPPQGPLGVPGPLFENHWANRTRSYVGEVFHLCSIVRRCHAAKRADLQAHYVFLWFTLYLLSFSSPMEAFGRVGSSSTDTLLQQTAASGNTNIHNHEI